MNAGLGVSTDTHAELFYGVANDMGQTVDGAQSAILPAGIDLSTAAAVNLIAHDWMTPSSSFDSLLPDASGSFDPMPAVGEIHPCIEAAFSQHSVQKTSHGDRGSGGSSIVVSSSMSYPRSVANLTIHGGSISVDSNVGTPKSYGDAAPGYYGGETGRHSSDGSVEEDEASGRELHGAIDDDDNEDEEEGRHNKGMLPPSVSCPIAFDGLTVCPSMLTKPADNGMSVEAVMASQLEELMASAASYNQELAKASTMPATQLPLVPFMDPMDQMDMMRQQLLPWLPRTFKATYSGKAPDNADYYTVQKAKLCEILLQEYAKQCRLVMIHVLQNEMAAIPEKMQSFWHTVNQTLKDVLHQPALWNDIVEADHLWYLACDKQYQEDHAYQEVLERFFEEAPRWVTGVAELMPAGLAELRFNMVCRFYNKYRIIKFGRVLANERCNMAAVTIEEPLCLAKFSVPTAGLGLTSEKKKAKKRKSKAAGSSAEAAVPDTSETCLFGASWLVPSREAEEPAKTGAEGHHQDALVLSADDIDERSIPLAIQGEGVQCYQVDEHQRCTKSWSTGPSVHYSTPPVYVTAADGANYVYIAVQKAPDVAAEQAGRVIWRWTDDKEGGAMKSKQAFTAMIQYHVAPLAQSFLPKHIIQEMNDAQALLVAVATVTPSESLCLIRWMIVDAQSDEVRDIGKVQLQPRLPLVNCALNNRYGMVTLVDVSGEWAAFKCTFDAAGFHIKPRVAAKLEAIAAMPASTRPLTYTARPVAVEYISKDYIVCVYGHTAQQPDQLSHLLTVWDTKYGTLQAQQWLSVEASSDDSCIYKLLVSITVTSKRTAMEHTVLFGVDIHSRGISLLQAMGQLSLRSEHVSTGTVATEQLLAYSQSAGTFDIPKNDPTSWDEWVHGQQNAQTMSTGWLTKLLQPNVSAQKFTQLYMARYTHRDQMARLRGEIQALEEKVAGLNQEKTQSTSDSTTEQLTEAVKEAFRAMGEMKDA
ncbi:hypothetical protein SYNPS1DRAFT_23018, partial [Syncephalis pseudoplumigaleata]